jgi:hypothetical protein
MERLDTARNEKRDSAVGLPQHGGGKQRADERAHDTTRHGAQGGALGHSHIEMERWVIHISG